MINASASFPLRRERPPEVVALTKDNTQLLLANGIGSLAATKANGRSYKDRAGFLSLASHGSRRTRRRSGGPAESSHLALGKRPRYALSRHAQEYAVEQFRPRGKLSASHSSNRCESMEPIHHNVHTSLTRRIRKQISGKSILKMRSRQELADPGANELS